MNPVQDNKTSKIRQWPYVLLLIIIAISLALVFAMSRKAPDKKTEARLPPLVELQVPQFNALQYKVPSQGTVQAKTETSLVSEVSGKIVEIADVFVAGGFFAKDDLLIKVEQADYKTAVKTAEAALANAKAVLEEEKARAKVAESDWLNYTEGKAPALGLRKPQLASALAKVQSAEADLERTLRDLSRTEIRAPYAGMVRSRGANLGQFVSRGNPLGVLLDTTVAEVRLPLALTDLADLGLPVTVSHAPFALPVTLSSEDQQWQAQLVRTEGVLDEKSRVIYVVAEIKDPYLREASANNSATSALRFGQFVNAMILGRQAAQVVQLPRHLLKPGNLVLVADNNMQLQFRTVILDRADQQFAYILSGFQAGDQLVTSPLANPLPGLKVRTSQTESTSENGDSSHTEKKANASNSVAGDQS